MDKKISVQLRVYENAQ